MEEKHILGKKGEKLAADHLLKNNFTILEKNWRFLKAEIDLIVQKGEFIVFVEVKTRTTNEYGEPESFVSNQQQKMIISAAHEYITKNGVELEARFDVISIITGGKQEELDHIEDAFYPTL